MLYLALIAALFCLAGEAYAQSGAPLYGQCGGTGWTGPTSCAQGQCTYSNPYYSQCLPSPATGSSSSSASTAITKTTISTTVTATGTSSPTSALPSSFQWTSTNPLIYPRSDSHNLTALKDPSVVYYNGAYHAFASTVSVASGYNMMYLTFKDFSSAEQATFSYLDAAPLGPGYRAAPQVFYFAPGKLWYLVFQSDLGPAYSTNKDIANPLGWSQEKGFFSSPAPNEIDIWTICDSTTCYLFGEYDNGIVYRSQTSISDFPNKFSQPVIALQESTNDAFEASNVYSVGNGKYLLIVEAIATSGRRYFRSWTSSSLAGSWTPLAATEANPFAGTANIVFNGTAWSADISHGEAVRSLSNVDQTMQLNPCGMRYLYQGISPTASGDYNSLPWKLALLTQTNC